MKQSLRNKTNVTPLHKNRIERTETADLTSPNQIIAMQRTIGNAATKRLLQREPAGSEDVDGTPTAFDYEAGTDPAQGEEAYRIAITKNLLEGKYTHSGDYRTKEEMIEGKPYQIFHDFLDPDLAFLLNYYIHKWAPRVEMKKTMGGDSSGKGVIDHPAWVKEFQQKLIGQRAATDRVVTPKTDDPYADDPLQKWDEASEGAQRLVEAYLNAWVVKQAQDAPGGKDKRAASNVEEFIHNFGASQSNDQAMLLGGMRTLYDWCANSSGRAMALGLMRRGLRFKSYGAPKVAGQKAPTGEHLQAMLNELNLQAVRFQEWGGESSSKDPKVQAQARKDAADKGRVISGKEAWTAELKPGDFITIIFGGTVGPISGHVATVVKEDLTQPKESLKDIAPNTDFSRVSIVSGNAAGVTQGETAIRIESFTRQRPADDYPALFDKMVPDANAYQYSVKKARDKAKLKSVDSQTKDEKAIIKRGDDLLAKDYPVHRVDGNKFKPGVHAPVSGDRGWVLSVTRSSMLDANSLVSPDGQVDAATLAAQGLEVFDEASLKSPNAGIERLYPGVLAMYE
jgi:hypothetical protein